MYECVKRASFPARTCVRVSVLEFVLSSALRV